MSELDDEVQVFLTSVLACGGVVIEDEGGCPRAAIILYRDASPEEQRRAEEALERLWDHTERAMREQGITEADVDRVLREDD